MATRIADPSRSGTATTSGDSGPDLAETPELLPLVIGVTGHRDLREEDREALEARVLEILRSLAARYPNTPLAILSPLADGADRLVARVALQFGARLIVPLPMNCAAYEEDFQDPASLAEFRHLLRRASPWFCLPEPAAGEESSREGAYARVGAYIASHCQILIAMWDGLDTGLEGGTSQVVRFKLEGVPRRFAPANSALDLPETGPVYHIVTPRAGRAEPEGKASLIVRYPGGAATGAAFDRIFGHMEAFNRDTLALAPILAEERAKARGYMVTESIERALTDPLRSDLGRYAVADTLAQHFQRKTTGALNALIAIVFVLALFFQAHVYFRAAYRLDPTPPPKPESAAAGKPVRKEDSYPWYARSISVVDRARRVYITQLDILYLVLLVLAVALFRRVRRRDYHNKYLDYRAIAEGLRVYFFWRLAGLGDSAADHYLRKQKGDLEWIRNAVRVGSLLDHSERSESPARPDAGIRLSVEGWVADQAKFFTRRSELAIKKSLWLKTLGNWSYYGGLAFLLLRAFAPPDHPLIIGLVLGLAVALLFNVYAKVTAFSEHAKQYTRMRTLFAHASRQLDDLLRSGHLAEARDLLRELGKESLAENGDWVLLHRDRPLELPRV